MTEAQLTSVASALGCTVSRDVQRRLYVSGRPHDVPMYTVFHDGTTLITFYAVVVEDWMQPRDAERILTRELEKKTKHEQFTAL